jgi:hypothetical protein
MDAARRSVAPTAARLRSSAADGWESTMTAVAPLAVAAVDGARQAGAGRRTSRAQRRKAGKARSRQLTAGRRGGSISRRWPVFAGLLAAGAVAGVVGAAVLRRQRQAEWDSYDAAPVLDTTRTEAVPVLTRSSADPGHHPKSVTKATDAGPAKSSAPAGDRVGATAAKNPTTPIAESARPAVAKNGGSVSGRHGDAVGPTGTTPA